MALDAGVLRVTLQYAAEIKDCDWFGRQDPYCKLRVGGQERRSRTCIDGGRRPVWDETFEFNIINENGIELTLMDEDTLARDDLIGTASTTLAAVRACGAASLQLPVCTRRGKQRGFVQVALAFTPNAPLRPAPGQHQPYPYQQQYSQAPYQAPYGYPPAASPAPSFAYGAYAPPPSPAPSFAYGYPAPAAPPPYYPPPSAPAAPQYAPAWPPAYQAAPPGPYGMQPSAPPYYGQPILAYGPPRY